MDIQKEKPEFNETLKLVEAVLERLTFHAFEEVLIWSNEHASRALDLCLKKTLKEFESGDLVLTRGYPKLKHFSVDSVVKALSTALDQAQDYQCNLNKEIDRLENQISKAQAVPEGFVLVPTKNVKYFSNDGENYEIHDTLAEAKHEAECAIEYFSERLADQLCDPREDGNFQNVGYGIVLGTSSYSVDHVVTQEDVENGEYGYEIGTEIMSLFLIEAQEPAND